MWTDKQIGYYNQAKKNEKEGKWEDAWFNYLMSGESVDSDNMKAIKMIIDSNNKGDEYRRKTKELNQLLEERKITYSQHYTECSKIHKEIYSK